MLTGAASHRIVNLMNDAIKTNRTAPKLTEAQRACLASIKDEGGRDQGWRYGSATLTSLRKRGWLERYRGYPWAGAKECNMWRITDAGRAALRGES